MLNITLISTIGGAMAYENLANLRVEVLKMQFFNLSLCEFYDFWFFEVYFVLQGFLTDCDIFLFDFACHDLNYHSSICN